MHETCVLHAFMKFSNNFFSATSHPRYRQLFLLLDTDFPTGPFRKNSANVVKHARRLKKMNDTLYGWSDVGKVLHLPRRFQAESMALAGWALAKE